MIGKRVHEQAAAASAVVGNGDNGETEITGREQFTKRYATYEEELAAAKAAEAEEEAAGGGKKKKKKSKEASGAPNKRKMNYGEEVLGVRAAACLRARGVCVLG